MFCKECGCEAVSGNLFCVECGHRIHAMENGSRIRIETPGEKARKYFSYGWTVLINLIALIVIISLFTDTYNTFEKRVYAILVLIYLSIQGFINGYSFTHTKFAQALDFEFKRIRRLLKNEPDEFELEKEMEARKKVNTAGVKIVINGIFLVIAYIIAVLNLFNSL